MWTQLGTRRADKAVGTIDKIEHRRNHERARDNADYECPLLFPRSRINKLSGLEILKIVVSNRRYVENYRRCEQRERNQRLARVRTDVRFDSHHQKQGGADHDQNSDAGERTVRRTNQARHVTAHRGDEKAHQYDVGNTANDERRQMRAQTARGPEISEQPADWHHADQRHDADNADRDVAFGNWQRVGLARFTRARCSHRAGEAARDWLYQFEQRPNGGNADRARANKTDFRAPSFLSDRGRSRCEIPGHRRKMRNTPAPADECADQHRDTNRKTDQMSDPEKRE